MSKALHINMLRNIPKKRGVLSLEGHKESFFLTPRGRFGVIAPCACGRPIFECPMLCCGMLRPTPHHGKPSNMFIVNALQCPIAAPLFFPESGTYATFEGTLTI
jgi:hypothetical protein